MMLDARKFTPKAEKDAARAQVNRAVRQGTLARGACEVCGKEGGAGHHDDYSKPLEVRWLCGVHHGLLHGVEDAI